MDQIFTRAKPEISIRSQGHDSGSRVEDVVEIFAVESAQIVAVGDLPQETIISLQDVIDYDAGHITVVGSEIGTKEAAGRLVWIKRADGNA